MTSQILPSDIPSDPLIKAARTGDGRALGEALQTSRKYLLHIAREELHSELKVKEDASDVVQVTLLKAQQNFPEFAGSSREMLNGWLRRILLNVLKDLARKYQVAEKRQISREVPFDDGSKIKNTSKLFSADPTPSEYVMANERQEALAKALERLSEDQRKVIFLRSRKHLGFRDIGRRMGRSAEAARLLWYRAVKQLAKELDYSR